MNAGVLCARQAAIAAARAWLGTPFHHAAKVTGVGVDCAHLLIACYCDTGIVASVDPEPYAPDWFLHTDGESPLERWVSARCRRVSSPETATGDILLFRYGRHVSHAGILADDRDGRVIHAFRGRGVVEDSCAPGTPLAARFASAWSPWGTP